MLVNAKRTFSLPPGYINWTALSLQAFVQGTSNPARIYVRTGALLDANGIIPIKSDGSIDVWMNDSVSYRLNLYHKASGTVIWTVTEFNPSPAPTFASDILGDGGNNPGPGTGSPDSQAMRVAQQLLHRANFTMGNNPFVGGFSTSAGDVTTEATVPAGYGRSYPASVSQAPMSYYGAVATLEGFGVRLTTGTFKSGQRITNAAWAEFGLYGDSFVIELEKGYPYRIMVEENGVDRYLPDSEIMNVVGTGTQLYRVTFPTRARRIITIEANHGLSEDGLAGRIGALYVKTADSTAFVVPRKTPKIFFMSDSAMMGTYPYGGGAGVGSVCAALLGIKDKMVSCNHSTGAVVSVGGVGALLWGQRRSDWQNFAPDVIVFRATGADLFASVSACVDAVTAEAVAAREDNANRIVIVLGIIEYGPSSPYYDTNRIAANAGIAAAIEDLNDPFIKFIPSGAQGLDYWLETGTGNEGAPGNDGPRQFMIRNDEHWSREGDLMHGISLAEKILETLKGMVFGADFASEVVASITPTSSNHSLVINVPVDIVLGTVSNGVPSSILSGTAPSGCNILIDGQDIKLTGTPDTLAGSIASTIVIVTDNGNVSHNITGAVVSAPVLTITPNSGVQNLVVDTPVDVILGTITNGTSPVVLSGTAPPGTAFSFAGLDLKLTGTPTTPDPDISTTIVIQASTGTVNFSLTGEVAEDAGTPWTPAQLTAASAWYVADNPANTVESGLTTILKDKTANGYDAGVIGAGAATVTTLNGRATRRTSGGAGIFTSHDAGIQLGAVTAGLTFYAVSKLVSRDGAGFPAVMGTMFGTGGATLHVALMRSETGTAWPEGSASLRTRPVSTEGGLEIGAATDFGTDWVLLGAVRRFDQDDGFIWVDGVQVATGAMATDQSTGPVDLSLVIGSYGSGASGDNWTHDWAELVAVRGDLTLSDRQKLEGYYAWEWGMQAKLDAGHPYKSGRPML